jgi:hypothetical protein
MKKVVAAAISVLWLLWLPAQVIGADETWLVGRWGLSYAPDGDSKDWLEFNRSGRVFSISPNGGAVQGEYAVSKSEVSVVFTLNGKSIPLTLKFTPDQKKLLAYSKRTGRTSEYSKLR